MYIERGTAFSLLKLSRVASITPTAAGIYLTYCIHFPEPLAHKVGYIRLVFIFFILQDVWVMYSNSWLVARQKFTDMEVSGNAWSMSTCFIFGVKLEQILIPHGRPKVLVLKLRFYWWIYRVCERSYHSKRYIWPRVKNSCFSSFPPFLLAYISGWDCRNIQLGPIFQALVLKPVMSFFCAFTMLFGKCLVSRLLLFKS